MFPSEFKLAWIICVAHFHSYFSRRTQSSVQGTHLPFSILSIKQPQWEGKGLEGDSNWPKICQQASMTEWGIQFRVPPTVAQCSSY